MGNLNNSLTAIRDVFIDRKSRNTYTPIVTRLFIERDFLFLLKILTPAFITIFSSFTSNNFFPRLNKVYLSNSGFW